MKPIIAISLVAIVATAGMLAGCSSPTGYQTGSRAATALSASADNITQTSAQLERTIVALNDLVKRPQTDLRPQFRTFTAEVDNLDAIARRVAAQADNMRARGAAYFDQWSQDLATIQNESIRSRSQARQQEVAARFQAVAANYDQVKAGLQPFLSDLRDVQRFLATDLTPGGIEAVEKFAAKADEDVVPLRTSLASLADEFREMGVSLTAAIPAPKP